MKYNWNLNQIKEALKESNSINEVLRRLNIPIQGNNRNTLKRILDCNNIEYEFNYKNLYINRMDNSYKPATIYLYNGSTIQSSKLLNKLIKDGIKNNECEICKIKEWQGEPLTLQLHHIDGNHFNNEISNLQVLCPNCHSQTDTYCNKSKEGTLKYYCPDCGVEINKHSKFCFICSQKHKRKIQRPTKEELLLLIKEYNNNKTKIGNLFGVTSNAVAKWYKGYNISLSGKELNE